MNKAGLPTLKELGLDLLEIPIAKRVGLVALPFLLMGAYFILANYEWWIPAVVALALLSFFTYGSISHDLVHGNLKLPRKINTFFLSAIELLALRSGHAYRLAHLHHHRRYPNDDDIEGAASKMSLVRTLIEGLIFQPKIYLWAFKNVQKKSDKVLMTLELTFILSYILLACIVFNKTPSLLIYAGLMVAGSWIIPLITSYIPHSPENQEEVMQTRLFRGKVLSIIALEHLYHLEHHLYPAVPHSNWPELAKRLDPHFSKMGLNPIKLWF
jgi:beta-carotene hydroxylase